MPLNVFSTDMTIIAIPVVPFTMTAKPLYDFLVTWSVTSLAWHLIVFINVWGYT